VNGPFSDRRALQKVKGLSAKAFTIAAGFLRVSGSKNFLDSTQGIESLFYDQVLCARNGFV
jgi:transcriptional accessory protein Tex/SPT6